MTRNLCWMIVNRARRVGSSPAGAGAVLYYDRYSRRPLYLVANNGAVYSFDSDIDFINTYAEVA